MSEPSRTDARMQQIQARADQVLAACTRHLVPIPAGEQGECFACGRVPDVRLSVRLDGMEMFWAYVCPFHHDETYEISVSFS